MAAALRRTRRTLVDVCKELDIDPASAHLQLLHKQVVPCDNCGLWDKPNTMHTEPDGTLYCKICIAAEALRF